MIHLQNIKRFLFIVCFSIFIASCKKDKLSNLGISKKFDITSTHTGTTYTMTVFYPDENFPTTPTPIIYLMDGFWYGNMVAKQITDLTNEGSMPKCILVSLDYKSGAGVYDRAPDLQYPGDGIDSKAKGDQFFQFLKTELIPAVETDYPSDTTQRTIIGHSLGGFFVLYSLLDNVSHPLFNKIIAASCSLGLGKDNMIFQKEIQVAASTTDIRATVFIGSGTLVGNSPAMHQEFFNRLINRNYPNLKIDFALYNETHGTDAYPTFLNGLKFIF